MKHLFSDFLNDHLLQYVHPIVNAKTMKIEFFEILSRVQYKGKIYEPKDFLENITTNQKYVMAQCILEKMKNFQQLLPEISFSINISSLEMEEGLLRFLKEIGNDMSIDPRRCIIEVLETCTASNLVLEQMNELKNHHGYRFALDDFGAGYSNFKQIYASNTLYEFIKIDGSMVTDIANDEKKRIALAAMVLAIQANDNKTVIEFIGDAETLIAAGDVHTDFMQGFIFGEPAPMEYFLEAAKSGMINIKEALCG